MLDFVNLTGYSQHDGNVDDNEIVVIGSQAVLGQYPRTPEALRCMEADVYPKNKRHFADLIDF